MLDKLNRNEKWRRLIGLPEPDLHAKDVELLLRAFAMLWYSATYKPSMTRFLNLCSRRFKRVSGDDINYCERLFESFLDACEELDSRAFVSRQGKRFNISTFEAVFVAAASAPFSNRALISSKISVENLERLKADPQFYEATLRSTASSANVALRKSRAIELL